MTKIYIQKNVSGASVDYTFSPLSTPLALSTSNAAQDYHFASFSLPTFPLGQVSLQGLEAKGSSILFSWGDHSYLKEVTSGALARLRDSKESLKRMGSHMIFTDQNWVSAKGFDLESFYYTPPSEADLKNIDFAALGESIERNKNYAEIPMDNI